MSLIYEAKPENKSGFILSLLSIAGVVLLFIIVHEEGLFFCDLNKPSDILIISVLFLFICGWLLFIIDEAFWQIFGRETCECQNMEIIITKYRLIKRKKIIRWSEITNISEYNPNLIWGIITFYTIAGTKQDTLIIHYGKGKKYSFGVNLTPKQVNAVVRFIIDKKHSCDNKNEGAYEQVDT